MSRLPILGAGALLASPPTGLYFAGAPWWGLLLAAVPGSIPLAAQSLALVLREIWPQESGHRMSLLREFPGLRRPAAAEYGQDPPSEDGTAGAP
ncbi:hypothetical protein [Streptomyces sp. NPDC020983]|uniref:hypothetical protein n=1 Tax=Streptomyces sp. NPDC020983 TaxID=3365106 RepID=UPI003789FBAD